MNRRTTVAAVGATRLMKYYCIEIHAFYSYISALSLEVKGGKGDVRRVRGAMHFINYLWER